MATLHRYFAACDEKGIRHDKAYSALLRSFEKGGVSYPRTGTLAGHGPLEIIDGKKIVSGVDDLIKTAANVREAFAEKGAVRGNRFMIDEKLLLTTPAALPDFFSKAASKRIAVDGKNVDYEIGFKRRRYYEERSAKKKIDEIRGKPISLPSMKIRNDKSIGTGIAS